MSGTFCNRQFMMQSVPFSVPPLPTRSGSCAYGTSDNFNICFRTGPDLVRVTEEEQMSLSLHYCLCSEDIWQMDSVHPDLVTVTEEDLVGTPYKNNPQTFSADHFFVVEFSAVNVFAYNFSNALTAVIRVTFSAWDPTAES